MFLNLSIEYIESVDTLDVLHPKIIAFRWGGLWVQTLWWSDQTGWNVTGPQWFDAYLFDWSLATQRFGWFEIQVWDQVWSLGQT